MTRSRKSTTEPNFFRRETDYVQIPSDALRDARRILGVMKRKRIPQVKVGVDGLPGAGKTTLSCALAKVSKLKCYHFHRPEDTDLTRDLPTGEGSITEHHRLFRTQDIEMFDVLIYLDTPMGLARERKIAKMKPVSSEMVKHYDYQLAKRIGDLAFDLADGESIRLAGSRILVKFRPAAGYRQVFNLQQILRKRGIRFRKSTTLEELLFLCVCGEAKQGLRAYLNIRHV